jgi:dTDP-4-amino-4,6-dideoxygalactose transaminase
MFYLVLPTIDSRQRLISALKQRGIVSVFHYQPLHLSEMGQKFGGKRGDCRVSEKMGNCLLRLPFYNTLLHEEVLTVVSSLKIFKAK